MAEGRTDTDWNPYGRNAAAVLRNTHLDWDDFGDDVIADSPWRDWHRWWPESEPPEPDVPVDFRTVAHHINLLRTQAKRLQDATDLEAKHSAAATSETVAELRRLVIETSSRQTGWERLWMTQHHRAAPPLTPGGSIAKHVAALIRGDSPAVKSTGSIEDDIDLAVSIVLQLAEVGVDTGLGLVAGRGRQGDDRLPELFLQKLLRKTAITAEREGYDYDFRHLSSAPSRNGPLPRDPHRRGPVAAVIVHDGSAALAHAGPYISAPTLWINAPRRQWRSWRAPLLREVPLHILLAATDEDEDEDGDRNG